MSPSDNRTIRELQLLDVPPGQKRPTAGQLPRSRLLALLRARHHSAASRPDRGWAVQAMEGESVHRRRKSVPGMPLRESEETPDGGGK